MADGDIVITPAVRAYLAAFEASLRDDSPETLRRRREALHELRVGSLTSRQTQVMKLRGEGLSAAGVAKALGISRKTVESHMTAAHWKTGVKPRSACWPLRLPGR